MRNYSKQVIFLLLIISIWSCDKEKSRTTLQSAEFYKLAIVDSVQVDLLTSGISIMDVHDVTGNILAIQSSPPIAYLLSPTGEILKKMDRSGQDPQAVGNMILSAEFYEDGIALMGQMRLKTYDIDFNIRKSLIPTYGQSGMIYMGFNHLFEFEGPKNKQLVAFFGGPQTELHSSKKEYYQAYNIVDVVDPYLMADSLTREENGKNVFKPTGELTPESRYSLAERAFYFMKPIFDVKENKLIYAFRDDTTLFKRSLPSGDIIEQHTIPFDKFILFQGLSLGKSGFAQQNQLNDLPGRIEKIYHVDGFDILFYFSGMKLSEMQELDAKSPDFRIKLDRIDYQKHLILKDGKKINIDLKLPERASYFNMADNKGYLWASKDVTDLEEEPEFVTFYKLKVVLQKD